MYPLSSVALPFCRFCSSLPASLLPRGLHLLLFSSSLFAFSFSSSSSFASLLPHIPRPRPRPPSSSVGVNLSPRLSPNPELYKLKPISLPGLRSSYSGHFIFVYLLSANMPGLPRSGVQPATTNDQRPTARRSARTRCTSFSHTRSPTLARFVRVACACKQVAVCWSVYGISCTRNPHTLAPVFIMHDSLGLRIFNTTLRMHALGPRVHARIFT